jgi:hypothetical protein
MRKRFIELSITTYHQFQEVRHYLMSKYRITHAAFSGNVGVFEVNY